ncbi:hypothetical protein [Nocardioides marmorisolisilvae]|uniref:hypothetical protein n=1 Tax=Nocardioides marmorisolisilvae TaxID=1542737 RepID=UPI0011CE97FC|nr:hypothetical protein [Nocardioides marmorisolisilvae]
MSEVHTLGRRFAHALADKDVPQLKQLLATDVDFRGLTPMKFWEAQDQDATIEIMLGTWFAPHENIDAILELNENDAVEDTAHVSYRFAITTPDGPHTAEQQAYYRTAGEQISYLRILCSGFRPVVD